MDVKNNLVKCDIDWSRWYDSIESAHLSIISPSGKSIKLYKIGSESKNHFNTIRKINERLKDHLLSGIDGDKKIYSVVLSKQDMTTLLKISNGTYK